MPPFPKLRFGSVCSGIEAASVAFAPLGWEAAWLAEVDVAASQVLAHRLGATAPQHPLPGTEKAIARLKWGDRITNYGDMTVLAAMVRARLVEAPDILVGGTPCQSFSVAGLRGGLADARGQLTMAFIALANTIDEIRAEDGLPPVIIIWENVPGVLSHADNPLGCFLAGLAGDEDALEPGPRPEPARSSAYWTWDKATRLHRAKWPDAGVAAGPQRAVAWRINDAQYVGLAQRRRRIFVVASAREGFDPAGILFEFEGVRRDSPPSREAWQEVAGTLDARTDGGGFPGSDGAAQYHVVPHGLGSGRPDGPVGLKWPADIASTLNAHFGEKWDLEDQHVNQACPLFVLSPVVQSVALRGRDGGATAELGGEAAYALRAAAGGGSDPYVLAPIPILEAGARTGTSTTDIRAGMGVGQPGDPMFTLQSGKQHAVCVTGDVTHTLKAEGFDASEGGTGRGQPIVAFVQNTRDEVRLMGGDGQISGALAAQPGMKQQTFLATTMAVRRLMPIECHRLQGFPDNWCAVPTGPKGKIAADGPQYKQLGNSWAVNHARWVGYRIAEWVAANPPRPVIEMEYDRALRIWLLAA